MSLNNFVSLTAVVVVVVLAASQVSANSNLDSLYENSAYKQSLAFDAPVLDSQKTLSLLKELQPLIPKDEPRMSKDLFRLINLSSELTPKICDEDQIDLPISILQGKHSLSAKGKIEKYGPNIIAFVEHYQHEAIEYCSELLKKSSEKSVPSNDMKLAEELKGKILPSGLKNAEEYFELYDDTLALAKGVIAYLKENTLKNLDELMVKSSEEVVVLNELNSIKESCKNFWISAKPHEFIGRVLKHENLANEILNNQFLSDWAAKTEICRTIANKIDLDSIKMAYSS